MACNLSQPAPSTAPAPTPTAGPAAPTLPTGLGPCYATSQFSITTYQRPSTEANLFSTIVLDAPEQISARTQDGWLGFDPHKAQAANIGVFRLRWIPPDAEIALAGDCASVPVAAWVPQPGVCYEMTMAPVPVQASPDASSNTVGSLNPGEFVAITGRSASGWLAVNGDQGTRPGLSGFVPPVAMNANGPCDALPTVPG